jgi:hypothetical protein
MNLGMPAIYGREAAGRIQAPNRRTADAFGDDVQ